MSRIVDNKAIDLGDALGEALTHSKALDVCVGYFNLRGWSSISQELESMRNGIGEVAPVRLIVGMAISETDHDMGNFRRWLSKEGDPLTDIQMAKERADAAVQGFVTQLSFGPQTKSAEKALQSLLADLKSKLIQVKLAARRRLHAKLYLCHMDGGAGGFTAFVGSSNFTQSGMAGSGELNIEETDKQKGLELAKWFKEHWEDNFSIDITDRLIEVIENSWAAEPQPSPRTVHLRLAYELSRDARLGLNLEIPPLLQERLVPWQLAAVQVGSRILETRGLVVVGDVVGLGKTVVGTAIAASSRERVLVICPKNLVKMWRKYFEVYSVHGRVVSLSMVHKDLPELKHYGVVLVDESHNLRHTTRKAWEHVHEYIQENDSKVILLTATMFNANELDISGQLALKIDKSADLGIRPEIHIKGLSKPEFQKFQAKVNGRLSSLKAFEESKESEDWKRLLSLYLVRRTREYLLENYSKTDSETGEKYFEYNDGTKFHFPKRLPLPLEYTGGPNDPCDQLVSLKNFEAIEGMTYARYQLGKYFADDFQPQNSDEVLLQADLTRATASKGFIETTVLKRLASSPKAFFITVEKMLLRAHVLRYAIENRQAIPIGTLTDRSYDSGVSDKDIDDSIDGLIDTLDSDGSWAKGLTSAEWAIRAQSAYMALVKKMPKDLRLVRPEIFDCDRLLLDLLADNATLQLIIDTHGAWDPAHDSKLEELIKLIESLKKNEKLLVFSEYADSIRYLEKHLLRRLPDVKIGSVTGGSQNPTKMARRFSPISNEELGGLPDESIELQVLLATDVLSEGQNLQDAAKILNWDLPWTIIKIIQRAGRVDRVGQKAKEIEVLSFKPHNGLEDQLKLMQRLRFRLETNQNILGGGETIFSDHITDDANDIYSGKEGLIGNEGDVDYASLAYSIWDKASESEQAKALAMGKGSHATSAAFPENKGQILVYSQAIKGEGQIFDLFVVQGIDGDHRTLTQLEAIKMTSSLEQESQPELDDHLLRAEHLVQEVLYPQAQQKAVFLNLGLRKRVIEFIGEAIDSLEMDDEIRLKANKLHSATFEYALLDSTKSFTTGVLNRSKRAGSLRSLLLEILELNDRGLLLDTANNGLKEFETILSYGYQGGPNV
jgi:hypothetical protein